MKPSCWRAWEGRRESKSCVQGDEAWADRAVGARRRAMAFEEGQ